VPEARWNRSQSRRERNKKIERDSDLAFAYKLARCLGYKSGEALLDDLTHEEWANWKAEFNLHPWGNDYERTSLHLSWLLNVIQRMAPGANGEELDWIPDDAFVPGRKAKDETIDDLERAAREMEALRL
jgi:hypothetical protein